ncbi:MAG: ferritin-like domain-containing protein [Sphingobacteriales bacterium]|nr:MAG: ferritin-like domain-containing protein [Sphingobacteriales bacterium]
MSIKDNIPAPPPVSEDQRASKTPPEPNEGYGPEHSRLKDFFLGELKDILWAEQKLVSSLPKMTAAATSPALRQLFETHLEETRNHVARLEKAFALAGIPAEAVKCEAMAGIAEETDSMIEGTEAGTATRDAALILAAQKAEHYEIATYGGLAYLANVLGLLDIKGLLEATLDEEKSADKLLSLAASAGINRAAVYENK